MVDKTAVSTFSTALSCFVVVGGGYANNDGLALDTNSNLGIYVRSGFNAVYLQFRIETNDGGGSERQTQTMSQGIPIPKVRK